MNGPRRRQLINRKRVLPIAPASSYTRLVVDGSVNLKGLCKQVCLQLVDEMRRDRNVRDVSREVSKY